MQVKDLGSSAQKFGTRAANAAADYVKGAAAAGNKWKAGVDNAEDAYNNGVQAAISRGAYKKGTSRAGADYYTSRVSKLGNDRYSSGVREGVSNWSEGFKPYADALNSTTLSAKSFRGAAGNQQRSIEVQIALRKTKEALA